MPGNVQNAAPTTTMPDSISTAYALGSRFLVDRNFYRDGESQRRAITGTDRKTWSVSRRLPPADLDALYSFFVAQMGKEFFFTDKDGATHTVRFEGGWQQSSGMARTDCSFAVVEVA